ncbi:carcinine hydrolase/isopenicillin-N N-acyltransferase family protein [Actinosynnema sp. CS-041913]|uniref:carcinine hydrolase/isopenicillin-N N-acyltransferase family protein n=1 Tax=Actinosynnema sp. CS-041913 TaxID=3239917 RepID=UPI003D8DCAFC
MDSVTHGAAGSMTFRAFAEDLPGDQWRKHVRRHWSPPSDDDEPDLFRRWSTLQSIAPRLVPLWLELLRSTGPADPALAAHLTHVDLPLPVVHGPQGTAGRALVRNLACEPDRFEGTLWRSRLTHRRVLGMTAGLWGLFDGMNDDGLVVSTTAGTGRCRGGLSGPILVRHLLEHCATVADVDEALPTWQTGVAHDLTVLDATGARAAYRLVPDRPVHRGRTLHWDSTEEGGLAMSCPPLFREDGLVDTVYTAVYRPADGEVTLMWHGCEWTLGFDRFESGELVVALPHRQDWPGFG